MGFVLGHAGPLARRPEFAGEVVQRPTHAASLQLEGVQLAGYTGRFRLSGERTTLNRICALAEPASSSVASVLRAFAEDFSERLSRLVTASQNVPPVLREAMRHSLLAPGKRLRPFLVCRCCTLVGGGPEDAYPAAAAMEMTHAFSLVHDDLPAMDDDDLRRGQFTCHRKFGEGVAILAGDALLALAFETLATHLADPRISVALVVELARGAGWEGMIGGQTADLEGEEQPPDLDCVRYIHERKTAALMESACRMGAIAGGADQEVTSRLGRFGRQLGLAFQIADDLLDVTSTAEQMGKKVGKDAARQKQTYPACVGMKQSRALAEEAVAAAVASLGEFGPQADDLRSLARFTVARTV